MLELLQQQIDATLKKAKDRISEALAINLQLNKLNVALDNASNPEDGNSQIKVLIEVSRLMNELGEDGDEMLKSVLKGLEQTSPDIH